jgi:hypothetical protein
MRVLLVIGLVLVGCGSPPSAVRLDPTQEPWYAQTAAEVTAMNREAERAYKSGEADKAAELIVKGEPLVARLLAVSHPTLGAARAAGDLDHLYGRMLLGNRHYGEARLLFQKNLARWKNWSPQSEETKRRYQQAKEAIAECDRHIME